MAKKHFPIDFSLTGRLALRLDTYLRSDWLVDTQLEACKGGSMIMKQFVLTTMTVFL